MNGPVMQWSSVIATPARLEDALAEACDSLEAELAGAAPDLLVAFASTDHSDHVSRLPDLLAERFPRAVLVGCSAAGIVGGGCELEDEGGISLTGASLPGVELTPFHLDSAARRWESLLPRCAEPPEGVLLLPDPFTIDVQEALQALENHCPGVPIFGGLASGATHPGGHSLFAGRQVHRAGAVGVALSGNLQVQTIVAQGCRPIGQPLFVTRAERQVIYELDGRPALSVLEALHGQLPARDQELFHGALFLGLVMEPAREVYRQGDFLIRNLVGVDPNAGALVVGATVEDSQVVQFHLRDARTSAEELQGLLRSRAEITPAGALIFSCLGRGRQLYGRRNHESDLFRQRFGQVPLGGFFCNGEIGPVQGHTYLHGYTSSLALFSDRLS
jgi:small ligand-binding sensory domain FIST